MSAPFTSEDRAFVRNILNNPADLTGWLVYADWLDEHGDSRAEFIRLELKKDDPDLTRADREHLMERLEELREQIEPEWVAVFDRPKVEHCEFEYRCPKQWESLRATADPEVRACDECRQKVYYCHTLYSARAHAERGQCVAVSLGVERYPGDLDVDARAGMLMGVMAFPDDMPEPKPGDDESSPPRRSWWKFW